MDNLIEDLRGSKSFNYMKASEMVISIERVEVDRSKDIPFVMYRSWCDADGEMHMLEIGRGTCSGIVDLGVDVPTPEPRKIENWAVLSFQLPI